MSSEQFKYYLTVIAMTNMSSEQFKYYLTVIAMTCSYNYVTSP